MLLLRTRGGKQVLKQPTTLHATKPWRSESVNNWLLGWFRKQWNYSYVNWASEITKGFSEGKREDMVWQPSLHHVAACWLRLVVAKGSQVWIAKTTSCPSLIFFPWKLSINLLRISTQSMGLRYLQQMSMNLRSPIFQEYLALVLSVASMCEVDYD